MPPTTPPRFGSDAERYDWVRPSYPGAGGRRGGRARRRGGGRSGTRGRGRNREGDGHVAERGLVVHALEPSPAMAPVAPARPRATRRSPSRRRPSSAGGPLAGSSSWCSRPRPGTWWRPMSGTPRAGGADRGWPSGGVLEPSQVGRQRTARPAARRLRGRRGGFRRDPGPLHPASEIAPDRWEDWDAGIASAAGLADPTVRCYESRSRYTTERYLELLHQPRSHSARRGRPGGAVRQQSPAAIDDSGGSFAMNYVTELCLARASAATMRTGGEQ